MRVVIAYLFVPRSVYRRSCCPHASERLSNYPARQEVCPITQHGKRRSPLPQPAIFQNSGSTTCNGRSDSVQLRKRPVFVHFVLGLHKCDYGLHTSRVNTCTLYGCTVCVTMPHVTAPSPQSTDLLDDSRLSDQENHRLLRNPNVHHRTHNIGSMDDIPVQSLTVIF